MDISSEIFNDYSIGSSGLSASSLNVYSFHTHAHLYYEMLLYQPFDGNIKINGHTIPVTAPTAVLIAPGDFHSTHSATADSLAIKMQCSAAKLGQTYSTAVLELKSTDSIVEHLFSAGLKHRDATEYLLSIIRMTAAEIAFHGKELFGEISGKVSIVSKAMQYINLHFQSHVTLTEAAQEQNYSEQYLSSVFSEVAGITFQDYLIEKRLSVAASLLRIGNCSVTEACYECGYNNLSHFVRSFKHKYGSSPGNFRKQYANEKT